LRNALRKDVLCSYLQHFLSFNSQIKKSHLIPLFLICLSNISFAQVQEKKTPQNFDQSRNLPNLFNPDSKIQFALKQDVNIKFIVYNIIREEII
jgi:hypothetical protein